MINGKTMSGDRSIPKYGLGFFSEIYSIQLIHRHRLIKFEAMEGMVIPVLSFSSKLSLLCYISSSNQSSHDTYFPCSERSAPHFHWRGPTFVQIFFIPR